MTINNMKTTMKYINKALCEINEKRLEQFNHRELQELSGSLKEKIAKEGHSHSTLVEAFAIVREAIYRVLSKKVYDVQIMGAIALHCNKLIEMQTGEGKTLTAVFPAYLNALEGKGVHILTFNDYLAKRDAEWMGSVYKYLGLSVGYINQGMSMLERRKAYLCDITYVTAKEAGFDYLRDFLAYEAADVVHRKFHYAIVDEADSILIDEATVPLVIAANEPVSEIRELHIADIVRALIPDVDYELDEYGISVYLTEAGARKLESKLGCGSLYDAVNTERLNEIHCSLHAEVLLKKDVNYIVRNNAIELIDEFTGRSVSNRHWPEGLQIAVEAKEGLRSGTKGKIMRQITLQSFLSLYPRVSGMTGTAMDSANEFEEYYDLEVIKIPTNRPCIRKDLTDKVFMSKEEKYKALVSTIQKLNESGQPILVGTSSIEESDMLAVRLLLAGIQCRVLNAKNDEEEARIIAQAGTYGAVTVSTNMAGRGTDILLGGSDEVDRKRIAAIGGLFVIGTNRHESIRIDKQLRGRAGRQGDPGQSQFFVSLEDGLAKRFPNNKTSTIKALFRSTVDYERLVAKRIEQLQRMVDGLNSDMRRTLWKYSYILEKQQLQMHSRRDEILKGEDSLNLILERLPEKHTEIKNCLGIDTLRTLEKRISLYFIDYCWAEYLEHAAFIKEGIHLKLIGGGNPLEAYIEELNKCYKELQEIIVSRIIEKFESLDITKENAKSVIDEIKGPSSTWTYIVNDNPFADDLGMMLTNNRNIGFSVASVAVIFQIPLFLGSLIYNRFLKTKQQSR